MDQIAELDRNGTRSPPDILPLRQQSDLTNRILKERFDTILPAAMRDAGLDVWLVLCQEDDPDPVFKTMIPMDTWAPILSMLVFVDEGSEIKRYSIGGLMVWDLYEQPYGGQLEEHQWPELLKILEARDPKTIGINIGTVAWAAGGLTKFMHDELLQRLPERFHARLVSAEVAATRWAGTLSPTEKPLFERVSALGQYMIGACFNAGVITPGVTTTDDLVWRYWQHSRDIGLDLAFRPFFRAHRDKREPNPDDNVIRPGDVIHCDVGIKYLRMNSDHQYVAYVPRLGETDVPAGLKQRMADTNVLQDIYMAGFRHGASGNEMLGEMLAKANKAGLQEPRIYSHNLGLFLHQPGPLIGLPWEQEDTGPRGDVRLEYDSAFVMELSTDGPVPEWGGQVFRLGMEEPVIFTRDGCRTLCGRQTEYYVI